MPDRHIGSYEQHCIDFALYGDPEREHYDHEFNAQFDRYDGWGDPDPNDDPGCPECGYRADCVGCKAALEELRRIESEFQARHDDCDDDIPF